MHLSDILTDEHRIIENVLEAIKSDLIILNKNSAIDSDRLKDYIKFFKNFVDDLHHRKEEKILFKKLIERGMSAEHGPLLVMLTEHVIGRAHVSGLDDAYDEYLRNGNLDISKVRSHLVQLEELMLKHIYKEDNILFPLSSKILTDSDQQELLNEAKKYESSANREAKLYYSNLSSKLKSNNYH